MDEDKSKNQTLPTSNSDTSPIEPLPTQTNDSKSKVIKIGLVSGGVFLLLTIGLILLFQKLNQSNDPLNNQTITPTPENEENGEQEPQPIDRNHRYVAYIKEDPNSNVWVVDTTSDNRQQITANESTEIYYSQVGWKSYDNVAYTTCNIDNNCYIHTSNLSTGQEEQVTSLDNIVIETFSFDHSGEVLAYIYSVVDGRSFVQIMKDRQTQTLKELPASLGRNESFNDQVSVEFSPNNRYLLVVNTYTQPNTRQAPETLWVFDTTNGAELFGVGTNDSFATDATWLNNEYFILKYRDQLIQKSAVTQGEIEVSEFANRYDPYLAPDRNNLTLWTYPVTRHSQLTTFDISRKRFSNGPLNFAFPQWIDNVSVVALETRESSGPVTFIETGRMMVVNTTNNATYELESGGVQSFAIEPSML